MEEPRFDWNAITRSSGLIVGVTGALGFAVPVGLTLALNLYNTGIVAGNEIFGLAFWAIAWGLTVLQGAWMLRHVGERIIDDMLVIGVISAVGLVIVKIGMWIAYAPINSSGEYLAPLTGIDAGCAVFMVIVALIAARINRY